MTVTCNGYFGAKLNGYFGKTSVVLAEHRSFWPNIGHFGEKITAILVKVNGRIGT